MAEAGCLMWLQDLTLTNVHHMELSHKVHHQWDQAACNNESFTIQNCMQVALNHWSKVQETELTIGPKPSGSGSTTGVISDGTQSRKKRKKNKKSKNTQSDRDGTAATVTKDKTTAVTPKDPPKMFIPSYCF